MTDHDLLARADAMSDLPHAPHQLIKELVAVLRARDIDLATAQAAPEREFLAASIAVWREIDRLSAEPGGYQGLGAWTELRRRERAAWETYRDWLASVSPPADRPTAHGDPGPPPVVPRPPEEP